MESALQNVLRPTSQTTRLEAVPENIVCAHRRKIHTVDDSQRLIARIAREDLEDPVVAHPADENLGEDLPIVGGDLEVGAIEQLRIGKTGPGTVNTTDRVARHHQHEAAVTVIRAPVRIFPQAPAELAHHHHRRADR